MADGLDSEKLELYRRNGYVVVENFLSEDETRAVKEEYKSLVDKLDPKEKKALFASNPDDRLTSKTSYEDDDYFITSGDKIRYFFEGKAFNEEGHLIYDKYQCVNKIGHALHWLNPTFKRITFSDKVKNIVKSLSVMDPVIIQSMYINKPPFIGSEVIPHQDATYLFCEPDDKVIGLWIALEDVEIDNGCLWFIPGSQKNQVQRRMVRYQDGDSVKLKYTGSEPDYSEDLFRAAPVKKGDLVIIHGKVVHRSFANVSAKPRPIYTFHIMDKEGSEFSELNWIQQTPGFKFPSLLCVD